MLFSLRELKGGGVSDKAINRDKEVIGNKIFPGETMIKTSASTPRKAPP